MFLTLVCALKLGERRKGIGMVFGEDSEGLRREYVFLTLIYASGWVEDGAMVERDGRRGWPADRVRVGREYVFAR